MTLQATIAIRAAKNRKKWGPYMTRRFLANNGISPRLARIARQCEATQGREFERRQTVYSSLNGLI
jgi:hypothetical protein